MSKVTTVKIDVTKIDKNRLFNGKKGTYLDAVIVWKEDQYGNDGFIAESVSKEEREAGKNGTILGNVKNVGTKQQNSAPVADPHAEEKDNSFPF